MAQFLSPTGRTRPARSARNIADRAPAIPHAARMNQVITDVPFGDGTVHSHMDTARDSS